MPRISFVKPLPPLDVERGANLMKALLAAGLPVASSCGGDGICGRCRIEILKGREHLSEPSAPEKILRDRLRIRSEFRISCQTQVLGDITIDTSYW